VVIRCGTWRCPRRGSNASVSAPITELRQRIEREFGSMTRAVDVVAGQVLLWSARHKATAYPAGRPLEPQTFVDRRHWS
jgi:hypothetical protein